MTPLHLWAMRHSVTLEALAELADITGAVAAVLTPPGDSEALVQSRIRLEAPAKGVRLWRNNVGVLENRDGRPVRYGLANDTKALNKELKSGDLIGWRSVTITPDMVGVRIAQFVSRECKPSGWKYRGDAHEMAQDRWNLLVTLDGGDARFATGEGTL
jgi:hypothetical protein